MTRTEIVTEVLLERFSTAAADITKGQAWVKAAERTVWSRAAWPFKYPAPTTISAIANPVTTVPADFGRVMSLHDIDDNPLLELTWAEFQAFNIGASVARSEYYAVMDRKLWVTPLPASGSVQLLYERKLSHLNTGGSVVAGPMTVDTDTPMYPVEYHDVLVPTAIAIGLRRTGDPAADSFQVEARDAMMGMVDDLVPASLGSRQYGADALA